MEMMVWHIIMHLAQCIHILPHKLLLTYRVQPFTKHSKNANINLVIINHGLILIPFIEFEF